MNNIKYIASAFLTLIFLLESCKSIVNLPETATKSVPVSFGGTTDSTSVATISWRQYFVEPPLISLIDTAIQNNLDLLVAFQRIQTAQSDVLLRKGALRPNIEGAGVGSLRKFGLYTMDGAGNVTTEMYNDQLIPTHLPDYFLGLQTSWEVDVWGKLKNQRKAAVARYLGSVEGKNWVTTNLISELAVTYYELLALDNELDIINETIALQENALEIVKVQKVAARTNELAVKQFEAQLLGLRSMQLATRQEIAENENKINFLVGRYPQPIFRNKLSFAQPLPYPARVGVPSALLQNRPDIKQAELELLATKADMLAAKGAFYPTFNINGSLGLQAFKTTLLFTTPESMAYGLFGNLTAPLINRSALKAAFYGANANQLEALYNYRKAILNGYMEVYNEMLRIDNLEQILNLKTREVDVATQSIETSSELFKTGRANYLEVLIAQQNSLQTRLELIGTKKNQFQSAVNLYKALGGGWR